MLSEKTGNDDNFQMTKMVWLSMICRSVFTQHPSQIDFNLRFGPDKFFVMKRKTRLCIYEVQVKANDQQSGHKRVWDMFLSDYGTD